MHLNEVEQGDEFNLSYPNIIMNILHAVLYTIMLSFFGWWSFTLSMWP